MNNSPPPYAGGSYNPPPSGPVTSDESTWASIAHLAPLIGYLTGVGHILIPLIIMLTRGASSTFVRDQAKEALNFQISMTVYVIIAFVMFLVLIGIPILIGLFIFGLVVMIQAASASGRGEYYRYPATFRLIP